MESSEQKAVNHTERSHALLSASGSSRWLNCTPSARLEEKYGEEKGSSVFAQEGTLAHEHAEQDLRLALGLITPAEYSRNIAPIRASELYNEGMPEDVQMYVDYCLEVAIRAKAVTRFAKVLIEDRVDLTEWIPESFGTNDFSVIADGTLYVVDLKYGKGIKVDATDNPQLKLYALGSLHRHELEYDINKVIVAIVQPRLDHISEFEISAEELKEWGQVTVKYKADLAYKGEGELCAGSWCQWCKIKARCSKLAEVNLAATRMDFSEPEKDVALLSDAELISIFESAKAIYSWLEAVETHVLSAAINGKDWPGHKLVEGRATRRWTDEDKAKALLTEAGYTPEQYLKVKLEGIGAIEKLVGKKMFSAMFEGVVNRPVGKPVVVPLSDKRPNMPRTAVEDFLDEVL